MDSYLSGPYPGQFLFFGIVGGVFQYQAYR